MTGYIKNMSNFIILINRFGRFDKETSDKNSTAHTKACIKDSSSRIRLYGLVSSYKFGLHASMTVKSTDGDKS